MYVDDYSKVSSFPNRLYNSLKKCLV